MSETEFEAPLLPPGGRRALLGLALLLIVNAAVWITWRTLERRKVETVLRPGRGIAWNPDLPRSVNQSNRLTRLRDLGPTAVRVLKADLEHTDPLFRWRYSLRQTLTDVFSLQFPGPPPRAPEETRASAAWFLGMLGDIAKPTVPDLLLHLDDNPSVALNAVQAIGRLGVSSPRVLEALEAFRRTHNPEAPAVTAAIALLRLDPENPDRVETIRPYLQFREPGSFSRHLRDCAELGSAGRLLAPALASALDQHIRTNPPSARMIQVLLEGSRTLFFLDGNPSPALQALEFAAKPRPPSREIRTFSVVENLSAAASILEDVPPCRPQLLSLLSQITNAPAYNQTQISRAISRLKKIQETGY